eukprot:3266706-Lingulodinium_polyedra.AAC.1
MPLARTQAEHARVAKSRNCVMGRPKHAFGKRGRLVEKSRVCVRGAPKLRVKAGCERFVFPRPLLPQYGSIV